MEKDRYEYLANQVFKSSLEVHQEFGPGLLESVYVFGFLNEFQSRNINFELNVEVPLFYKGQKTPKKFYIDILVENEIVVEVKACEGGLHPLHLSQLLSYMKLAGKKMGFLVNFHVPLLKNGFKRLVNNY